MASWDPAAELSHPVDYRLVQSSFVSRFQRAPILDETVEWLRHHEYDVVEFDATTWGSVVDLLDDFADRLAFPDYFGRNLDALNDCLSDVASHDYGWRAEATGLVVVLRNFDAFVALDREVAHRVLAIVADQARSAMLIGNRILCLVHAVDGGTVVDPGGAIPVVWNDAKWRRADQNDGGEPDSGKSPPQAEPTAETEWFAGDQPRTVDEKRFLARLRVRASAWTVSGLTPEASSCLAVMIPLIVDVAHPFLARESGLTRVEVGYWPPTRAGVRLEGEWGDGHLLDNGGDGTDLRIQGLDGDPEFFADAAAAWISAQLLRPLERLDWGPAGHVHASEIRLVDGQTLVHEGRWFRRRGRPDRVTRLQ